MDQNLPPIRAHDPLEEPPSELLRAGPADRSGAPPPAPPEERPRGQPPRRRLPLGALILVLAVPAAYFAYQVAFPTGEEQGSLPPLVPLELGYPDAPGGLSAAVDEALEGPAGSTVLLAVRATGSRGVPLPDTLVHFRVTSGGGALAFPTVRTDGDGLAAVPLTLSDVPGTTVVSAEIDGSALEPVRFHVTTLTGTPEQIEIVGGDEQEAAAGGLLPERMAVRVSDGAGNPVPGAEVIFQVVSGGGLVGPTRPRTDSLGEASARWRLGFASGTQRLMAVAAVMDEGVTFAATAQGGLAETPAGDGATPGPSDAPEPSASSEPVSVARLAFAVGGSHVCTLAAGRAVCRGANDRGQSAGSASGSFAAVATGTTHTCGLDASGAASCWGANESGQLGDGSRTDRTAPVAVATDLRFFALAGGASHTCGLAGSGRAVCWGQNLDGQLGDGSRDDRSTPRAVAGGSAFVAIASGWNHTCAVSAGGEAFCWGLNGQGQLGNGSRLDRLTPTGVPGQFTTIAAGSAHTCGISGGEVRCWGRNNFGQLGDGTTGDRASPVAVQGLPGTSVRLAAGAVHTCALVAGGAAYCWGQNLHGQLGDGSTQNRPVPTPVGGSLTFESIFAGGALTCGFTASGTQYCWGLNQNGQLGDGSRASRALPARVIG